MSKNNSFDVTLNSITTEEIKDVSISGTNENSWQVTYDLRDAQGDPVDPSSLTLGSLQVAVKPVGHVDFDDAVIELDITNGEYFQPFDVKAEAFKMTLTAIDAGVDVNITIAVV